MAYLLIFWISALSSTIFAQENYFLTDAEQKAFAPYCQATVSQWLKWEARANVVQKSFGLSTVKA